jgi:response regulator RpfG family c-di-GMP phosphodiesterase
MEPIKQSKNVLLADDDDEDVLIFKNALRHVPIVVNLKHARDGEMLFILLRQMIPDIIFLDINIPYKNGVACVVDIRKNKKYDHVPIIMYTAIKGSKYIDESYESGANFYMLKGESVVELAEKLKKIFAIDWGTYVYYPPKGEFVIG